MTIDQYSSFIKSYEDIVKYFHSSLILCNRIIEDYDTLIPVNNTIQESDDEVDEVMQWFIIDDSTAKFLIDYTNEAIYYHEKLDIYVWAIFHYGTPWESVKFRNWKKD